MESLEWLKNLERLCLILLFGFCLLTFSASSVMAVDKSNSTTSTSSSSSTSSPSSSHPHSSSHNKDTYSQGSAAGKNDGKVGVYDLAAACPSGSSACAAGYKHSFVETCTKSTLGCGDGPTTLGSTSTSKSSHNHNTATKTSSTSSSATPPHTKQNITNLVIQVVTDNQTSWDGGYCCTPGTLNTKLMGNLSNPLTGTQQFSMGCSADFLAMARIDSSAHNPPHLTINVLDNDKVIGSNTTNTINDNATVNGKC